MDPAVRFERLRRRGPDRASSARRRHDHVHHLRRGRLGARLPRRTHLEGAEGMSPRRGGGLFQTTAVAGAVAALGASVALAPTSGFRPPERPNILLVLTDDQTIDTLPSEPAAMPWFQS